ncbi:MAG: DUF262 domain-containing HNH endonuclease family protein [Pseudomonadota bacterium]
MKELKGETITVSKLFSEDFFFKVPEYQRPFSWEDDNFLDLVNDLSEADRSQEYFLGTIVLQEKDNNNYDIVDGQQRLTALSILLACIRDKLSKDDFKKRVQEKLLQSENVLDGIPAKTRLEVKDRKIYSELIITDGGTISVKSEKGLPEPEWRYVRAINLFKEKLANFNEIELEQLVQFISRKCVLIYLSTSTFDDAFRLFTIVNDRGKQLRRIDILKSVNISPDVVKSETVRSRIAQQWEEMEKDVGEDVFESIFHLIRLIIVKDKPQGDLLKEFEERIFKRNIIAKGDRFVDLVSDYVGLYKMIFEDRDVSFDSDIKLNKFKSLMYVMNSEFKASEWKSCILFFAKKFELNNLYEFVLAVEKVYLAQWVKGLRKDERFSEYADILRLIDVTSNARSVIDNIKFDGSVITSACDNKNFYGAGYAKYFLLRLELLASEHDASVDFTAKSIEHVLPQSPQVGSDWEGWNRLGDVNEYVNTVGNLVLLSKGKNSSARNFNFDVKKTKYLGPRVSSYPRSVEVLQYSEWSRTVIDQRTSEVKAKILQDI